MTRGHGLAIGAALLMVASIDAPRAQRGQATPTPPPPPAAGAAISGVVSDGVTGRPIADALVRAFPQGSNRAAIAQYTDAKGRFVLADLPADAGYSVRVSRSGYDSSAYGWVDPAASFATPIPLAPDQWFSRADVKMWRTPAISGTVTDEQGDPVAGVFVRALLRIQVAGRPSFAGGTLTTTDDRGRYRLTSVSAGDYVVMVPSVQSSAPAAASAILSASGAPITEHYPIAPPPLNGQTLIYPITFSGSTTLVSRAAVVTVTRGVERDNVDIRLTPMSTVKLSGIVRPADSPGAYSLRLLPEGLEDLGNGGEAATAVVGPGGAFVFYSVVAGNYTIDAPVALNEFTASSSATLAQFFYGPSLPYGLGQVRGGSDTGSSSAIRGAGFRNVPTTRRHWARTPIVVGARDETNVVVSLKPTLTVTGRIVADDQQNTSVPTTAGGRLSLDAADGSVWLGSPRQTRETASSSTGEFVIDAVLPGRYIFRANGKDWLIKSVVIGGQVSVDGSIDTTPGQSFSGVVVTMSNSVQRLSGFVRANASTIRDMSVIAFPAEVDQWKNYGISPSRIKITRATATGGYELQGLPGGDYYVIAVPAEQENDWQTPGFFAKAAPRATKLSLGWGATKALDLALVEIR